MSIIKLLKAEKGYLHFSQTQLEYLRLYTHMYTNVQLVSLEKKISNTRDYKLSFGTNEHVSTGGG